MRVSASRFITSETMVSFSCCLADLLEAFAVFAGTLMVLMLNTFCCFRLLIGEVTFWLPSRIATSQVVLYRALL